MGRVNKNLENGKVYLDTDLDPAELAVIGRVTVLWGRLEHLMMLETIRWAASENEAALRNAISDVFSARLRAFFEAVRDIDDEQERKRLTKLHSKIDSLRIRRHQLTHGYWDWDNSAPNSLIVVGTRPKREFESTWDTGSLYRFGSEIGEVLFELEFPGGWRGFLEERASSGSMISRDGLRLLSGTLPPEHPMANTLKSLDEDSEA